MLITLIVIGSILLYLAGMAFCMLWQDRVSRRSMIIFLPLTPIVVLIGWYSMKRKKKLWKGLWGCDAKGFLYTPSHRMVFWLPPRLAFKLHRWLNDYRATKAPLDDQQIIEIKKIARDVLREELEKAANPDSYFTST